MPRRVLQEKLGGGVRPACQNLTLFMTKICDIPYPIYDLPYIKNLFQTSVIFASLVQTNVKLT